VSSIAALLVADNGVGYNITKNYSNEFRL